MKKIETKLQHPDFIELESGNRPLTYPIYQSAKFETDDFDRFLAFSKEDYFYSRVSNPTVRHLELQLAHLQGRKDSIAFSSGISSMAIPMLALLEAGDHVISLGVGGYLPTRYLIRNFLSKFKIDFTFLFPDQSGELKNHIRPKTKLIVFESPTNPTLHLAEINKICRVAKEHKIFTLLDNTLAGFHQHGQFEIDYFSHSLTKYASGHGDVMGGVIIGDEEKIKLLKPISMNIGSTLDPHAAYLISRGLKTYSLRYDRQCQNAKELAERLLGLSGVTKVVYPGLPQHPQHELAKFQMSQFGTLISVDLEPSIDRRAFVNRLKYFKVTGSLGSTESLIVPSKHLFGSDLSMDQLERIGLNDTTFRLSIGLESVDDLIQDLELALL